MLRMEIYSYSAKQQTLSKTFVTLCCFALVGSSFSKILMSSLSISDISMKVSASIMSISFEESGGTKEKLFCSEVIQASITPDNRNHRLGVGGGSSQATASCYSI